MAAAMFSCAGRSAAFACRLVKELSFYGSKDLFSNARSTDKWGIL